MAQLKLLLVDDSSDFLRALSGYLGTQPTIEVVGMVRSVEEALTRIHSGNKPDLVLMDINLPGTDGLTGTRRLKAESPDMTVIIVSLLDGQAYRDAATAYGADGFVSKARLNRDLLPTIQTMVGSKS
jgi:DNA-binding NarL/FixJ family response regulator